MVLVGSDDGVYRVPTSEVAGTADPVEATKTLDSGRVMRLRRFDGVSGAFAATTTGLYRYDGDRWTGLGVPRERVYAVGAAADGDRLYAGTRPAHVYVADVDGRGTPTEASDWRELWGFQELPSRDEWQLPRHDDLAQVRDLHADPETSDRVVAGVEVGGVHVSDDGGETWTERRDGVDDDVHELHVTGAGEYVAATGFGLFRTSDAGRNWTRLDEDVPQRYFRAVFALDGTTYAAGALAHSATWDDDDADPALFAVRDDAIGVAESGGASDDGDSEGGTLERLPLPRDDETVTGMTAVGDDLLVATHRGSLFVRRADGWGDAGAFPVDDSVTGRYTPLVAEST
ncbi:hypothetical protein ACFO0N_09380 [Halobium salinum]|uniref:BNR repeat-containing protein n=1 Tax=Halobium salinum TaxID=1364940 RepID=A0ABD5PCF4_9EURY|nr:glycosyl hydrolase [Halobium salinum]